MRTYQVWSITTGNAYAKTFTDEASAREVLDKSQETWPDDEFGILAHNDDGTIAWLDEHQQPERAGKGETG